MQASFLSLLILALVILSIFCFTIYYWLNRDVVESKILGDSSSNYDDIFNK